MSAKRSCRSCSDLQEKAPDFVQNGVTDAVDLSLRNNTGFSPSSGNNDCTDLNNANDCLIGNMEDEVDAHEVCDWKPFMIDFIHNVWSVIKAIISAICGLWTKVERTECMTDYLFNGQSFSIGEETTGGSYVAAGKGVSFLGTGDETGKSQISLTYIAGGICQINGTIIPYIEDFTDTGKCTNFDNGAVERKSTARKGNQYLTNTYGESHSISGVTGDVTLRMTRRMVSSGELLYEIRIKKSQFPMIKQLFGGNGFQTGGGEYHVMYVVFDEGEYACGQHGYCRRDNGVPTDGADAGHLVPEGWIYVQCRMVSITYMIGSTKGNIHKYTPRGYIGVRLNGDNVDCAKRIDPIPPTPDPDPEPTPSKYTVVASAVTRVSGESTVSTTGGTVSPASQEVTPGGSATVTATAKTGYTFLGWAASATATSYLSTSTSYNFVPTDSMSLYAIFNYTGGGPDPTPEPTNYTITTGVVTDGVVSTDGGSATGDGTYSSGNLVTVTASVNSGYRFLGWTETVGGEYVAATNPYNFSIAGNRTLYANFAKIHEGTHEIRVQALPFGAGTVLGGGNYNEGDTVTLTAVPLSGYRFVDWAAPQIIGTSNPLTFTVTSSTPASWLVSARFAAE